MRVHFRLVDAAEGEHGNVKAAEGKERVFILAAEDFHRRGERRTVIRFEYRPATLDRLARGVRARARRSPRAEGSDGAGREARAGGEPTPPSRHGSLNWASHTSPSAARAPTTPGLRRI